MSYVRFLLWVADKWAGSPDTFVLTCLVANHDMSAVGQRRTIMAWFVSLLYIKLYRLTAKASFRTATVFWTLSFSAITSRCPICPDWLDTLIFWLGLISPWTEMRVFSRERRINLVIKANGNWYNILAHGRWQGWIQLSASGFCPILPDFSATINSNGSVSSMIWWWCWRWAPINLYPLFVMYR